MSGQGSSGQTRELCTLQNSDGNKFDVYLTAYETERANSDQQFASELVNKYAELYPRNLLSTTDKITKTVIAKPSTSSVRYDLSDEEQENTSENTNNQTQRDYLINDDDELLISLVSARPPLFDLRLPLKERSKEIINTLWEEVIEGLNIQVTVKEISARWKNIRDSYLRARANIKKKMASGSSAEEKIRAEGIKSKHKNYALLEFLDDTLTRRNTSTNVVDMEEDPLETLGTPSTSTSSRGSKRPAEQQSSDELFFKKMDAMCRSSAPQALNSTQHFCLRLAESLHKLPKAVKNRLEIDFLQKFSEAELLYCNDE